MKKRNSLICLLLALSATLAWAGGKNTKAAANRKTPATRLCFDAKGEFKLLQITDLHARYDKGPDKGATDHSFAVLNWILDLDKPDFVVFTGDVTREVNPRAMWEKVTKLCSDRGIPYAITFGNHDAEMDTPPTEVMKIITSLPGCMNTISPLSQDELKGYTNQMIPIYESADSKRQAATVWLIDSHRSGPIAINQVAWYSKLSRQLTADNGGTPLPALAFMHRPLPEYEAASTAKDVHLVGYKLENDAPDMTNAGLFAAMKECGDVMGVFCGHNHDSDYLTLYQDICLGYGRFAGGRNTYHNLCDGTRMFILRRGQRSFDTWIRSETFREVNRVKVPDDLKKK